MREVMLKVEGMHCTGCENRIKNSLKMVDGVKEVMADHEKGVVKVVIDEDVSVDNIKEEIEDLGFEVKE